MTIRGAKPLASPRTLKNTGPARSYPATEIRSLTKRLTGAKRHWRMRQDPPVRFIRIKEAIKAVSGTHPSTKQQDKLFRNDLVRVDTPAQPQPQAMGAARRDPRRGEIPVTRICAVSVCRPRLGK